MYDHYLPAQRAPIAQIKDLVWIEKLSEAGQELKTLHPSRLDVDEDQEGNHTLRQFGRFHLGKHDHCIIKAAGCGKVKIKREKRGEI